MAEQQPPSTAAGGVAAVRLNPFWTNSLAAWFRAAEAQFTIWRVTCPLEKYYAVLTALSEANTDRVRHIVEADFTMDSYDNLMGGLFASHVMSDYQKIDQLLQMEPLNGRKPSDMLVEMEKLKPADVNQYLFLHRLPREVRVLLTKEPVNNMRALAEKVDAFMALHRPQSHNMAAPVAAAAAEAEEDQVAPVKHTKKGSQAKGRRKQRHQRSSSPVDERKSPLCWLHIRFGERARRCEQPCAWPAAEN
jgi:hypothetical protein